jgi:outer membrane protein TolC
MTKHAGTMFVVLAAWSLGTAGAALAANAPASPAAAPAPAGPLTVDAAVKMALERSSLIIGAEASVIDARSGLYRSYSGILPLVQITGSRSASVREQLRGTQSFSGLNFPTPRQDFTGYTNSPTISGSWNFLDLSAISGYSAAKSGLHAAELAHKSTRQEVALDVRRKFYEVVKAFHLARVSTQALRLSRDDERRVRALFNVGSVSRSDLLKAQVRTAQSELDSIAKHNGITVTRITLATTIGIEEANLGEVDTVLTAQPQPYDDAQILAEAVKARPDIQAAKADWDAARASLRAANYLRFPYLSVSGSATYRPVSTSKTTLFESSGTPLNPPQEANTRSDVDRIYSGQIGFTWNIFTGFGNEASIASSRARVMRAKDNYESLHRNLAGEVRQILQTYREVVEAYNVTQRAIESAEESVKLTQQKYNVGSSTILDLIDAQVQLQSAQSDAVSALAGMRVAEAAVEKVRGRGD